MGNFAVFNIVFRQIGIQQQHWYLRTRQAVDPV
jgi:hypothetical protein